MLSDKQSLLSCLALLLSVSTVSWFPESLAFSIFLHSFLHAQLVRWTQILHKVALKEHKSILWKKAGLKNKYWTSKVSPSWSFSIIIKSKLRFLKPAIIVHYLVFNWKKGMRTDL